MLKNLLEFVGVEEGRVNFEWVSASEGGKFAELVQNITKKVKELGPADELTKKRIEV